MSVFLSYASADKKLAEKLKGELGKLGVSVWSDSDLTAGEDWRRRIEKAIQSASQILILVSPRNSEDSWQQLTWRLALEAVWQDPSKRLIPILLRGAAPPPFIYSAASAGQQIVRLDDPHKLKDVVREIEWLIQDRRTRDADGVRDPPTGEQSLPPVDLTVQSIDPPSRGERLSEIKEYAERLRSSS